MRTMLTSLFLVVLVFVLSTCERDPLLKIICKPDFDFERCIEEESKK